MRHVDVTVEVLFHADPQNALLASTASASAWCGTRGGHDVGAPGASHRAPVPDPTCRDCSIDRVQRREKLTYFDSSLIKLSLL